MLILDTKADMSLATARVQLVSPQRRASTLPALGAAALAALSALALAGSVILGPPGTGLAKAPTDVAASQG